jgi:tetratricopeptide (TPR) repeat protein
VLGCEPSAAPAPTATPTSAASTPPTALTPAQSRRAEWQALATATVRTPGRTDPVDAQLEQLVGAAKSKPTLPEPWVVLGQAWVVKARQSGDVGHYTSADACASLALDLAPDLSIAQHLRLLVMQNNHAFEAARALATQLTSRDPDDFIAHGALSDAHLELGHLDAAVESAQKMVDLKPSLPSFARMAHLRWLLGDLTGARDAFKLAFDAGRGARDPEPVAWVLVQAATLFWHQGDLEGVQAGVDFVHTHLPNLGAYAPLLQLEGRLALARGETRTAVERLKLAYATTPTAETAWLLADAHLAAGDADAGAKAEAEVLRLGRQGDPRTLAQFLAERNRDADEAVTAATADRKHRGGPYADDALAFALYRAGRLDEALPLARSVAALKVPDARLDYHAGLVLSARPATRAEGHALLERALKTNPHFDARGVAAVKAELQRQ